MRSAFLAFGLFVFLWGSVFLFTDELEVQLHHEIPAVAGWFTGWGENRAVFHPPEWAAIYLCSFGFVMATFAIGLPHTRQNRSVLRVPVLWSLASETPSTSGVARNT